MQKISSWSRNRRDVMRQSGKAREVKLTSSQSNSWNLVMIYKTVEHYCWLLFLGEKNRRALHASTLKQPDLPSRWDTFWGQCVLWAMTSLSAWKWWNIKQGEFSKIQLFNAWIGHTQKIWWTTTTTFIINKK